VHIQIHIIFNSPLAGGEWLASRPGRFIAGERIPATRWIGGWEDHRTCLDLKNRKFLALPVLEIRLGCQPPNQSL
jgi:hypothetical protein